MSISAVKADRNGISALDGYLGFSDSDSREVEGISPQKRHFRYIRQGLRRHFPPPGLLKARSPCREMRPRPAKCAGTAL